MTDFNLVPCFYKEQDYAREKPAKFLPRHEARELRDQRLGRFIDNGKAFRLFQSAPASAREFRAIDFSQSSEIETDCCISFQEMQANVGIVAETVRNQREFVKKAQAKVRWYQRIRSYPKLAYGRWSNPTSIQVSA